MITKFFCQISFCFIFGFFRSGIGGVFILKNGNAHQHVTRGISEKPIDMKNIDQWLKFFDMPAILIALGTFVSDDMDLDLRLQHFHSFSTNNWGGHYHYDTTPDTAEYEAYFNVGNSIIRVDQPDASYHIGVD